jgi:transposase
MTETATVTTTPFPLIDYGVKKKQLLAGAEGVFASGAKTTGPPEDKTAELYEQIGRLKVELDWVKKKSTSVG